MNLIKYKNSIINLDKVNEIKIGEISKTENIFQNKVIITFIFDQYEAQWRVYEDDRIIETMINYINSLCKEKF